MCSIQLHVWQEAVGPLTEVSLQNGQIQATLAEVGIVVLPYQDDHYQKLLGLKGKRVAILRTNDGYAVGVAV